MSLSTAKAKVPHALKLTAALAATSGALNQTLLAVARAHGVNGAALSAQAMPASVPLAGP